MAVVIGEAAVAVRAEPPDAGDVESSAGGPILSALEKIGGKGAALLGGILGGVALGAAFNEGLEREALSDRLAAQLGLSEQKSAEVGKVAGELYANAYGDSMEDVNDAVGAVMTSIEGMGTATSDELSGMTSRALNFATTFQVEVGRASQIAGQLMRTGLAANGMEAFDLLTAASQRVPSELREDVLDAADEYGQFFATLGYSGEQAFSLLVDGAQKGMYGIDKAGDAIKEFTIRSTDMSAASTAAYKTIGLDAEDMANSILAGGADARKATQQIIDGLLGIKDPAVQANTSIALFGTPLEDLNATEIPQFLESLKGTSDSLGQVAGASDRMGETLNDNAQTNLTSFWRQLQKVAVDVIGGQVLPAFGNVALFLATEFGPALEAVKGFIADEVIPRLRDLSDWMHDNATVIRIVAAVIAAIFIPHLIALAAQATLTGITTAAMWVASKVGAIQAAAVHSAQIVWMIARWVALGAAAVVQGAIVAAVWTASIVASAVTGAAGFAVQVARVVGSWLLMGATAVAQGAVTAGVWVAQIVAQAVSGAASFAVQVARVVAGWVLMGAQSLAQAARMAAAWVIAMGPVGWVITAVVGLVALIIANWETVKNWTVGAFTAIWNFLVGLWNGIVSFFQQALQWIVNLFLNWTLIGLIIKHWDTIKAIFVNGARAVIDFMRNLPSNIANAVGNLGRVLWDKGRQLIQGLVDGISGAARYVGNVAKNIVNGIINFVNDNIIDGINNLLEFTIMGVHINPPDIPHIPRLHEGGVFSAPGGEGLAVLRDQELVVTPEQRVIADHLLSDLLSGSLAAGTAAQAATAGNITIQEHVHQAPGEPVAAVAARVTQNVVWRLNGGITRTVGGEAVTA